MSDKNYRNTQFLDPSTLAKISQLEVRARYIVEGFLTGLHKSPYFGHSVEFVQHREYVIGDDIRHIDWKVWSRTDHFYIKQFEEETNLRCTLVVDVSESMQYGNGPLNKYEYSCTIAACLAYMLIRQHDACGLITFDSDIRQILPSKSSQVQLDSIIQALKFSSPSNKTDFDKIVRKIIESIPSKSLVIIFSDLLINRNSLYQSLKTLKYRNHDIMIFHILDDDELDFPFTGTTRFEGLENLPDLMCDPRSLRESYLQAIKEYLIELRKAFSQFSINYLHVRTSESPGRVLSKFLCERMSHSHHFKLK